MMKNIIKLMKRLKLQLNKLKNTIEKVKIHFLNMKKMYLFKNPLFNHFLVQKVKHHFK